MKICHLFFKNTFFLFCFFLLAGATAKAQPCDQQQDSAQVLYFYQALGITVPTGQTLDTWPGVTLNSEGCVWIISLSSGLNGVLTDPDLPHLERLWLRSTANGITDTVPDFSGLPELKVLFTGSGGLSGLLPDFHFLPKLTDLTIGGFSSNPSGIGGNVPDFDNLPHLINLDLCFNSMTGAIPNFTGFTVVKKLDLSHNGFSGIVPDFSHLPATINKIFLNNNQLDSIGQLSTGPGIVKVSYNLLTFDDILPNKNELSTYWPQFLIPVDDGAFNTNGLFDLHIDDAVIGSEYTWSRNGTTLEITETNELALSGNTTDYFTVRITNPNAPNLTLKTKPFQPFLTSAIEETVNGGLGIFPNPADGFFIIEHKMVSNEAYWFELWDMVGKKTGPAQRLANGVEIPTHSLAPGMYWVKLLQENGTPVSILKLILN